MALPAQQVDAYLAKLPTEMRAILEQMRRTIRAAAPQAEGSFTYQMPASNTAATSSTALLGNTTAVSTAAASPSVRL